MIDPERDAGFRRAGRRWEVWIGDDYSPIANVEVLGCRIDQLTVAPSPWVLSLALATIVFKRTVYTLAHIKP